LNQVIGLMIDITLTITKQQDTVQHTTSGPYFSRACGTYF